MGDPSQPDRTCQRGVLAARAEVTRARRIIEALREAEAQGKGAASLDGKMIDAASERMAANVIAVADAIANRAGTH
jgi:citrate lyase beta subunit